MGQAVVRLKQDVAGDSHEDDAVGQRCQHLKPVVAVGLGRIGRPGREVDRKQRQGKATGIGNHVSGVCQEREAI
jgi:hypothetical protein